MDGYETTRYIRTSLTAPLSQIPIIAMTAHAFNSDVSKCLEAGMNDYVSKPFKQEILLSKIARYLIKHNMEAGSFPVAPLAGNAAPTYKKQGKDIRKTG
jgi:CheY-like chemotaxis protein